MTWPRGPNDRIWGYNETTPLYPGDTTGHAPGAAERRGRRRHERVGGHLHRLPLLRQGGHHARVPVRLRPLVHDVRLLEAEGAQDEGRRPRRHVHASRTRAAWPAPTRRRSTSARRATSRPASSSPCGRSRSSIASSSRRASRRRSRCTSTGGRSPTGRRRSRSGSSTPTAARSPSATPTRRRTCRCRRRCRHPARAT